MAWGWSREAEPSGSPAGQGGCASPLNLAHPTRGLRPHVPLDEVAAAVSSALGSGLDSVSGFLGLGRQVHM